MKNPLPAFALTLVATPVLALDCPTGERAFSHKMLEAGTQCVPEDPQRIAFVSEEAITAWILGTETITKNVYFDSFVEAYPGAVDAGVHAGMTDAVYLPRADMETIARAEPDLIVTGAWWSDENTQLAKIVTTLAVDYDEGAYGWEDGQDFVAQLVGAEQRHGELMADYRARLEDLRAALPGDLSFAVVRPMDKASAVQVFTTYNFGAQQLEAVGMTMHDDILTPEESAKVGRTYWYELSLERIDDLNADYLVVLPGWDADIAEQVLASPFWQSLPVVAEGRLIQPETNGEHYIRENLAFAHLVLDDVWRDVLGQDPAEVSPNPFADWLQQ